LPNVLLEAMAMQTPVVATRVAGVPRLLRHDVNGLLVAPNSEGELADALQRLLASPELRDRLAQAGRSTIEAEYSFATRMSKVRDQYDVLLRDARTRSRSGRGRRVAAAV
jgi:glycosyltransferase involved in cell wall biosynthesis